MVAPVQKVTMEDKENFDPRSATTTTLISTTSKKAPQTIEKIENEANSVMQDADSDISSDGFDVSEGLELDEASLSDDENSQGKRKPSNGVHQNQNCSLNMIFCINQVCLHTRKFRMKTAAKKLQLQVPW